MCKDRENYFFTDVQVRGSYPAYAKAFFEQNHIKIEMEEEDKEILKENTADYVSFSYYSSRCTSVNNRC